MSFFQVTAAELRKKAEQLKGLNSRFKTGTDTLQTTEQALKSMWEGEANDAFHAAFVRDKGQMDQFHNVIEQFIEALLIIAAKYEAAENKNISIAATRSY
ncbi:MAG: WXG100 family type VII secretion target [Lachnospiraceae bacterium]|nr:WXG100 family type VII secretion target [Lachnospiraceae bacterium]